jgi:hypothetical protein
MVFNGSSSSNVLRCAAHSLLLESQMSSLFDRSLLFLIIIDVIAIAIAVG